MTIMMIPIKMRSRPTELMSGDKMIGHNDDKKDDVMNDKEYICGKKEGDIFVMIGDTREDEGQSKY